LPSLTPRALAAARASLVRWEIMFESFRNRVISVKISPDTNVDTSRLEGAKLPVCYIDGPVFGEHHVVCEVGVDTNSKKTMRGLVEGAPKNTASTVSPLENFAEREIDPSRHYLFETSA